MNETCSACKNYLHHYCLKNGKLFRVNCGHCTVVSPRRKRPGAKACKHFVPGTPAEDMFVSKKYLSKELLQYVLSMELLPEIGELPHAQREGGT